MRQLEESSLRNKIVQQLRTGPSSAPEIAMALGVSENEVLPLLDQLRFDRVVEFAGGEWNIMPLES